MATQTELVTAAELLEWQDDGKRRELIRGEVIEMSPAGREHGKIAMRFGSALEQYVATQGLGEVYAAETGFRLSLEPDTVRAPDVSFVARERAEAITDVTGYLPGAPDLAVEVVSPSDRFSAVEEKVWEWLNAGARMVVVLNPRSRTATVYRSRTDIVVLQESEALDGGDVVPGWSVSLREMFR